MKLVLACVMFICPALQAQDTSNVASKYIRTPTGFLMVLNQGDSVMPYIEALAIREKVPSATITGLGFVNAIFGFYNLKTRAYDPKTFNNMELASMTGSIAWQDNMPSLHVHGVVSDKNFNSYGGHMLAAIVGTGSVEITITVHQNKLQRVVDQAIGANVLQVK